MVAPRARGASGSALDQRPRGAGESWHNLHDSHPTRAWHGSTAARSTCRAKAIRAFERLAGTANANIGPCAFWPVSRDNTIPLSDNRAHGALITAALLDAAVPLPNSLATHTAIHNSRLVTVDQRVHTPLLSGQGNACMTSAVTTYLLTGQLPGSDLSC